MHNHKKLKVWSKAMDLTEVVYQITAGFPVDERFGLTSQLRRCAVSIPSNIAEGAGRQSEKEFIRFLNISLGSIYELETQYILAVKLGFATESDVVTRQIDELQKMLFVLIRKQEEKTLQ